jgi:hypothetical protein
MGPPQTTFLLIIAAVMALLKCSVSGSKFVNTPCGLVSRYKDEARNVLITSCSKNIDSHIKLLGLNNIPSEGHLICYRAGIFNNVEDHTVCPHHRSTLGVYWRQKKFCVYPSQSQTHGQRISARSMTLQMSRTCLQSCDVFLPVGSGKYCTTNIRHFKRFVRPKIN